MTTLFISDLHLDAQRPQIVDAFLDFLHARCPHSAALYILGDFFEAWIGDDATGVLEDRVAAALARLHAHRVPVYFMHGNRDFLLGDVWARQARLTLLPDPSVVEIAAEPVLLMHGDTLCTDDVPYQAFRALVRDAQWQRGFLGWPRAEREAFAAQARTQSRRYTRSAGESITDVNPAAVEAALRKHRVRTLIHGHTHRPAQHQLHMSDGSSAQRIVLGDWYEQGNVLEVDAMGRHLHTL